MAKGPVKSNKKPAPSRAAAQPAQPAQDEDTWLWRRVTETVTPLSSNRVTKQPLVSQLPEAAAVPSTMPARSYKTGPTKPAPAAPSPKAPKGLSHGTAAGVDKRTNQRLIKGKMPIEGRLDLHGHTREAAHRALRSFISEASAAGRRCVIVITGKGLRLDTGEIGVLRQAVPQWLNGPELRPLVLAYSHAIPKDGGEGALYVLLKRKR